MTDFPRVSPEDQLRNRLADKGEVVLSGCAGVGKTYTVQKLLGEGVVLCAPTAKAALRLADTCGQKAFTVHSLIYGEPTETWLKSDGSICRGWKEEVHCACAGPDPRCYLCSGTGRYEIKHPSPGCPGCTCTSQLGFGEVRPLAKTSLLVVDEASMVGTKLANDIRSTVSKWNRPDDDGQPPEPIRILWVGDPAQLPPVGDKPGVDLQNPDVMLTHVYRAQGGILQIATKVRQANSFVELARIVNDASEGSCVEVRHDGLEGLSEWRAGRPQRMAIVHTNRQRTQGNMAVRGTLKRAGPLIRGDRLLIRKNNPSVPVWNGQVYRVESVHPVNEFTVVRAHLDGVEPQTMIRFVVNEQYLASMDKDEFGRDVHKLSSSFRPLASITHDDRCTFNNGTEETDCVSECQPGPLAGLKLVNAQFGFVITCHASQGNEADDVGVLWTPFTHGDRFEEARSWLYTACTRARKSLTIWTSR